MAHYLLQVAYTPEAWAAMLKNPQDRRAAVEPALKKLGGSLEQVWFSFGEYDLIGIMQMPDNVAAATFSIAVSGGGACKTVKTTPLLTTEEALKAMREAGGIGYKPATAQ
jgi:uncharacterized protein with GYD domain